MENKDGLSSMFLKNASEFLLPGYVKLFFREVHICAFAFAKIGFRSSTTHSVTRTTYRRVGG